MQSEVLRALIAPAAQGKPAYTPTLEERLLEQEIKAVVKDFIYHIENPDALYTLPDDRNNFYVTKGATVRICRNAYHYVAYTPAKRDKNKSACLKLYSVYEQGKSTLPIVQALAEYFDFRIIKPYFSNRLFIEQNNVFRYYTKADFHTTGSIRLEVKK